MKDINSGELHRVLAIDGGKNALYSILTEDKLAMIYDADVTAKQ